MQPQDTASTQCMAQLAALCGSELSLSPRPPTEPRDAPRHRLRDLIASWKSQLRSLKRPRDDDVGEDGTGGAAAHLEEEELSADCASDEIVAEPQWIERLRTILATSDALQRAQCITENEETQTPVEKHVEEVPVHWKMATLSLTRPPPSLPERRQPSAPPPKVSALTSPSAPLPPPPVQSTDALLLQDARAICHAEEVERLWPIYSELRNLRMHRRRQLAQQCVGTTEQIRAREQVLSCLYGEVEERLRWHEGSFIAACGVEDGALPRLYDLQRRMAQLQSLRDELRSCLPTLRAPAATVVAPAPAVKPCEGGAEDVVGQLQQRARGPTATVLERHFTEQRQELLSQMQDLPLKLSEVQTRKEQLEERYRLATEAVAQMAEAPGTLQAEVVAKLREQQQQTLQSAVAVFGWELLAITSHDMTLRHTHTQEVKKVHLSPCTAAASSTAAMLAAYVVEHEPAVAPHEAAAMLSNEEDAVRAPTTTPSAEVESACPDGPVRERVSDVPSFSQPAWDPPAEVTVESPTSAVAEAPVSCAATAGSPSWCEEDEEAPMPHGDGAAAETTQQDEEEPPQAVEQPRLTAEAVCEPEDLPTVEFSNINTEDGDTTRSQGETAVLGAVAASSPMEQGPDSTAPSAKTSSEAYTGFFSESNMWDDNE